MESQAKLSTFGLRVLFSLASILTIGMVVANAEDFVEGEDYRVVETEVQKEVSESGADETDNTIKVVEFFNYGCPHCYTLEPFIKEWLEEKEDDVEFVRVAVPLRRDWIPLARAYYIAEKFDVVDRVHDTIFKAIFEHNLQMQRTDLLEKLFVDRGVDAEEFHEAYKSEEIGLASRESGKLMRLFGLEGTPAVVVNDQFVVDTELSDGIERMFEIVEFLVEKIRNEKDEASQSTTSVDHTENP